MHDAAIEIIDQNRSCWPLSLRRVFYRLARMAEPPRRNTDARFDFGPYQNDLTSYTDLSQLHTRARLATRVDWEAIGDESRPLSIWRTHQNAGEYVRSGTMDRFAGYQRDFLLCQPIHIEIVGEKMTVGPIVDRVASPLCANVVIGRGFSSLDLTTQDELFRSRCCAMPTTQNGY